MKPLNKTSAAPAKINLCLAVKGRRADGYHDLESFMQKLELADRLTISVTEGSGISLRCPGTDLATGPDNLAWRAARLFLDHSGSNCRIELVLEKNIPVAAGLGGGSSDAAAVLLTLNELLGPIFDEDQLAALGVTLGADVPFFVRSAPAALAKGIGELLTPMPGITNYNVVLVNPGFPVSTKWVYDNFALTTTANPYIFAPGKNCQSSRHLSSGESPGEKPGPDKFFNDLESVTIERYPEIARIKNKMLADGAWVSLMSGSGPTVFGLFSDNDAATASYDSFRLRYGNNVFLTVPSHS